MKSKKTPQRSHFPTDEATFSWLSPLLDAYAVIDEGIAAAVKAAEKQRGAKLACAKGCTNCCCNLKDIPVYPLELVGIYWFSVEKISQPVRGALKKRLLNHARWAPCPFLIDDSCSIYPLRPAACRQFNVFTTPSTEGEDPYYTRRDDVLTPIPEYVDRAFSIMLPFYGVTDKAAQERVIKGKLLHTQARVLQACSWNELAGRMDDFDLRNSRG